MKNRQTDIFGIMAVVTVIVTIPALIGYAAAPSATPPNQNIDSVFNTIKAGYGATVPGIAADFMSTGTGVLGQATAAGGYGISGMGTTAANFGIMGTNTNAGGSGGWFQHSTLATSIKLGTPNVGMIASFSPPALVGGAAGAFFGTDPATGTNFMGGLGVYSTDAGGLWAAGAFESGSGASRRQVALATAANAIDANGGIKNAGLTIAKNGFISGSPSTVKFADLQGLEVANDAGTTGLRIAANGDISDDSGGVKVADTEGLEVSGTSYGVIGWARNSASFGGSFSNSWDADADPESSATFALYNATGDVAGEFTNFDFTGTVKTMVRLGTENEALDATGVIRNAGLTIATNGDLSDSGGPVTVNNPVNGLRANAKIYSNEGVRDAALLPNGRVLATGRVNVESFLYNSNHSGFPVNPTYGQQEVAGGADDVVINDRLYITPFTTVNDPGQPNYIHGGGGGVAFNDAQGVTIDATNSGTGSSNTNAKAGLIVNNANGGILVNANNGPTSGLTINALNGDGLTINTSAGGVTLKSTSVGTNGLQTKSILGTQTMYLNAQAGTAQFDGRATSHGGFGTYTFRGGNSITVAGSAAQDMMVPCLSNEIAVSCGYSIPATKAIPRPFPLPPQIVQTNVRAYILYPSETQYSYSSGSNCYGSYFNETSPATSVTVTGYVQCYDPAI